MRIILKPMGVTIVLIAFATLAWMATRHNTGPAKRPLEIPSATNESPKESRPAASPVTGTLQNGTFESDFVPIEPYDTKAHLSGSVARPWHDDSSWAPVTVDYAIETENPHGGKSCQKVVVSAIDTQTEARVQFVQSFPLLIGQKYRASCWLRADRPTEIDVALRQKVWPYQYYGVHKVTVGTKWQEYEVTGTPEKEGETFLMIKVSKPLTFWVDDAAVSKL